MIPRLPGKAGRSTASRVKFGVFVPQGWRMDLVEIDDPIEQYEAMTHVAREADKGRWDSIWVFDHFHPVPEPSMETTMQLRYGPDSGPYRSCDKNRFGRRFSVPGGADRRRLWPWGHGRSIRFARSWYR